MRDVVADQGRFTTCPLAIRSLSQAIRHKPCALSPDYS